MNFPRVVSRDEWLVARKELLAKEKEATRARDTLRAERQALPMVEIDKEHAFEGPDGEASLLDLFEGRLFWYAYEPGGNLTFFTGTQGRKSRKAGLIQRAGVLSLTVQREEFPYRYVTIEGAVAGADRPPSAEQVLAVVRRYLPEEAAQGFVKAELEHPSPEFVLFTVRPDRWLSFDFGDEPHYGRAPSRTTEHRSSDV